VEFAIDLIYDLDADVLVHDRLRGGLPVFQ
jgi:hypothetical protein